MSTTKLTTKFDYDLTLIALLTSVREHKLCWEINKKTNIALEKKEHLIIPSSKKKTKKKEQSNSLFEEEEKTNYEFTLYDYEDEDSYRIYTLLSNSDNGKPLVKEHKEINYWLIIKEKLNKRESALLLQHLNEIKGIISATEIDINNLPSKQHFIF